jgi:hypothetical protein
MALWRLMYLVHAWLINVCGENSCVATCIHFDQILLSMFYITRLVMFVSDYHE